MDHPKIGGLSDGAFRLWVQGLAYCQKYLTDGFISDVAMRGLRAYSPKRRADLDSAGLWHLSESGIRVHDYLQWNESREHVLRERRINKQRMALFQNPELRAQIRARDGDDCRYCGRTVRWTDRKGALGGTYDHIVPDGGNSIENLVVACRGCNSKKGGRTPAQAGMTLKSPSKSDLDNFKHPLHSTPQEVLIQGKSTGAARRPVEISEGKFSLYTVVAAEARDLSIRQDQDDSIGNIAAIFKTLCATRKLVYDGELASKAIEAVLAATGKRTA